MSKQIIFMATIFFVIFFSASVTFAATVGQGRKILYIPIDNRPCNLKQTVEVIEKLGYAVVTPPENFLGRGATPEKFGKPDELWNWLENNAAGVDAAVISTDAMIYGSLVGSRNHELSAEKILERAKKFEDFNKKFPYIPIYAFGTIMRTPTAMGSSFEPEYYKTHGDMIWNYTRLKDKSEVEKLSRSEQKNFTKFEIEIPSEVMTDWFSRRERNYNANEYFINLASAGVFQYFLIGCDDNAPFSQTHMESRHLEEHAKNLNLGKTVCLVTSGADELGMLMISRAVNKNLNEIPFVAVSYNAGKGKNTIPTYCNEPIGISVSDAIIAAGGLEIPAPERADLVLAVNTNFNGKTFESSSAKNKIKPRRDTKNFMSLLKNFIDKNYPVGVIDIATANGADNALMNQLKQNDWQFKITAYGGWNTATNSSGFLIGAGVLTKFMNDYEKNSLLLTRYFDDWAYQTSIRTQLANGLIWAVPGEGNYLNLNEKREGIEKLIAELAEKFAAENFILPQKTSLKNIRANSPWSRCFEADISFEFDSTR